MKKLIIKFLKPFVLAILKDALKVESNKNGLVTGVKIAGDPPNPDPTGPIAP